MSTILFFTSDRFAFANLSPSATTEKIILTPDPVDGSRLFIGNSTMISYDVRCNISTFDGSRATMTIDTLNNRVGIGISSPTVALDIVDAGGVRIVGPTNITGATTFTGNSRVIGTATATSFTGSAIGLTSIPAARIVGSLPAAVYANATIPVAALSGYDNGSLLLSGHLATETLNVSTISTQHIVFSSLSGGNAEIDTLSVRSFSTAFGFTSTFTIGTLFVGSISSGSIGSFQTITNSFSSISAGTAAINFLNTSLLSTGSGTASSFTVGILYAATISSGTLISLSSALVSVSNAGVTNATNITTVSNAGVSNATNITSVSNAVITVSNATVSISNTGTTNSTNITTVSNIVNYLLAVSNISAITISTSYGFFSTISTGSVYGRFIGDGSLLTNLPVTSALTIVSNTASTNTVNITSVSNSVTEVSNNIISVSNTASTNTVNIASVSSSVIEVSNNLTSVSNSVTEVSNNIISVSNTASTNTVNIASVSSSVVEVSNNLTSVSNSVTEVSNRVNYLLAVSNISAVTMSTSFGFFSTISTGRIFGRFVGDGSGLTGIPTGVSVVPPVLSTTFLSTGFLSASNISVGVMSTTYGFFSTISAGSIFGRFVGDGSLLTNLPVTAALTTVSNTGTTNNANITTVSNAVNFLLGVSNISTATMSTSFGFFSTISAGSIFGRFVGDGSLLTGIVAGISIVPPVLSTSLLSTGILTARNISTVVISTNAGFASSFYINNLTTSTITALLGSFSSLSVSQVYISSLTVDNLTIGNDNGYINMGDIIAGSLSTVLVTAANVVALNISATIISTNYGFFSTISTGRIFGRFVGDGSGLTGIATGVSVVPPVLSTTFLSTGFLSASNISVGVISTTYGFFSTISAGSIFGRFVGDGSLLTNLPVTAALTTVSNTGTTNSANITTVSNSVNYLLAVSNISAVTMSTTYGFFSTISAGSIFGRFVGDGSLLTNLPVTAALTIVSNTGTTNSANITTVSNSVNYLLAVSNISAVTMSTSFGFFSTISAGSIFGRFVGDGSLLTNLPVTAALTTVSNTGTTNSGNITTVSNAVNYLLAVSNISAVTMSTSFGFFSTISTGSVFGRFVGDGSGLTGIPSGIVPPVLSTTLLSTGILTARNISTTTISTSYGFFSTISTGSVFGRFVGDGSGLTGIASGGISIVPPVLSTTLLSTGILTARNISTLVISTNTGSASSFYINFLTTSTTSALLATFSSISAGQAYISSLTVDSLFIGNDIGFTNMGDIIATSLSTIQVTTGNLIAINISTTTTSTNYGFFSTISAGSVFGRFVGDGSGLTGIASGGISIVPPVLSTTLLSTGNLTARNISVGVISTTYGFFSTISAGSVFGRFVGDGSLLTNLPVTAALTTVSNSVTTVSNSVNYLLAVSNISAVSMSTSFGFFSTISAGTVFGRFVGDGSLLTNLPVTAALTTVSNTGTTNSANITTVSNAVNFLLAVSNVSAVSMSTSFGFFSTISAGTVFGRFVGDGSLLTNLPVTAALTTVSNAGTSNTTNITTVSNSVNYLLAVSNVSAVSMSTSFGFFSTISAGSIFGRFVGDGSLLTNLPVTAALTTVSNTGVANSTNITTLSNTVNYLLAVSNISAVSMSTSFGFFSTISAGSVFGRFVGDGSLLTNLPVTAALTTVSNSVNYLLAVSNISAVSMSTSFGFFSTISAGTVFGRFVGDGSLLTNLPVTAALTTVSNSVTTVSNSVNYLLAVSNVSAVSMSTSFGFFSTISAGTVFGRFVGDGSLLTGIVGASGGMSFVPPVLSTTLLSTGILTARSISTTVISSGFGFFSTISAGTVFGRFAGDGSLLTNLPVAGVSVLSTQAFFTSSISSANITSAQGYISSLIVDVLSFGLSNSYISMGDVIATSISTIQTFTSSLLTINLQVGNVSSLSYISFPGLQQGYTQSIVAEQATGTGTQELLFYKGSTTTDRIRMQTTGSIIFEPGVSARVFPATGSNVTPAMIINSSSNVGIGIAVPTVALDVAGTGRFQILSTQQLFVSSISSGLVYGRFAGDGSLLTGIVGASGGLSYVPPVLSTTLLSTGNLTANTINTDILNTRLFSTASGSASTFTIGTLFAGMISSASIGSVLTAAGAFSSISVGTANIDILNARLFSTAAGTASSFTIGSIFGSSGSISSIIGNEAKISTVTTNTLSSYIVYASSVNTPNIYVTNIYANDGGIANVVASSLNASRAVFVQVIASSFQGSLIGKNLLTVETY